MAKKPEIKEFTIAVVGLSGTESIKGPQGVGKSCLCNRFVRPAEDNFYTEHLSLLSAADFNGQIINNDHFLYWGQVCRPIDESGTDCVLHIIEQTEFLDDTTFAPLRGGKTDPYLKRCAQIKVQSAEKYMYICRDQLGLEEDYEKVRFPGKVVVDGFICAIDVSSSQPRPMESQLEFVNKILVSLVKTKKPIVVAATKSDVQSEAIMNEVTKMVGKKEFKGQIAVIETSAVLNVNADLPFLYLTALMDKTRSTKPKILSYSEADKIRKDKMDQLKQAYIAVLDKLVTNYKCTWRNISGKLELELEYRNYRYTFGQRNAENRFKYRVSTLRNELISAKQADYLSLLPALTERLLPDLKTIGTRSWADHIIGFCQRRDFSEIFCKTRTTWHKDDTFLDSNDTRIPIDFLTSPEAEAIFRKHHEQLLAERQRQLLRQQFEDMLSMDGHLLAGTPLREIDVYYKGRDCYDKLSHHDRADVYQRIQVQLRDHAKKEFLELLYERSEVFVDYDDPDASITQEDVESLMALLSSEQKCKALSRCEEDRKVIMLNHLGFLQYPIKEQCPFRPNCMETSIQKTLNSEQKRGVSSAATTWKLDPNERQINLLCIGSEGLATELVTDIRNHYLDDEYIFDDKLYSLDYRTIEGDVTLPQNALKTSDFVPQGCICVYSSVESLEFLKDTIYKTFLANSDERLQYQGLPVIIVQAYDMALTDKGYCLLREEGQLLAQHMKCEFVDAPDLIDHEEQEVFCPFNRQQIPRSMREIALAIVNNDVVDSGNSADLRILMCMMCGDSYNIHALLQPLQAMPSFQVVTNDRYHVVQFDTYISDQKRKVEILLASYHDASLLRDEFCHGYILVYSSKRQASFSTLSMFINRLGSAPVLIVAATDGTPSGLTNEGRLLSQKQATLFVTTPEFQHRSPYMDLFSEAWKHETQQNLYNLSSHSEDYNQIHDSPNSSTYYGTSSSGHNRTGSFDSSTTRSSNGQKRMYDSRTGIFSGDPWIPNTENSHHAKERPYARISDLVEFCDYEDPVDALSDTSGEYTPVYNALVDGQIQRVRSTVKRDGRPAFPQTDSESDLSTIERPAASRESSFGIGLPPPYRRPSSSSPRESSPRTRSPNSLRVPGDAKKANSLPRSVLDRVNMESSYEQRTETMKSDTPSEGSEGGDEGHKRSLVQRKRSLRSFRRRKNPEGNASGEQPTASDGIRSKLQNLYPSNDKKEAEKQKRKNDKRRQKEEEKISREKTKKTRQKIKELHKRKSYMQREGTKTLQDYVQEEGQLIPRFIELCVRHIETVACTNQHNGAKTEGIYRVSGNQNEVGQLKMLFAANPNMDPAQLDDLNVFSVATALKSFVSLLSEPLVPEHLYPEMVEADAITDPTSRLMAIRASIKKLPPANHEVLRYIITHLYKITRYHEQNQMGAENLAICWWPTIIKPEIKSVEDVQTVGKAIQSVTTTMIERHGYFFYNEHEV